MDAHPIYRWLTLMFMTVQIRLAPVNNARGKPLVTMISSLGGAILFPAAFLIGAESGLIGIAWAWLVAAPLLLLLSARLTAPRLGLSLRSEEHTSELQSLMRISYAVLCLKKKNKHTHTVRTTHPIS